MTANRILCTKKGQLEKATPKREKSAIPVWNANGKDALPSSIKTTYCALLEYSAVTISLVILLGVEI